MSILKDERLPLVDKHLSRMIMSAFVQFIYHSARMHKMNCGLTFSDFDFRSRVFGSSNTADDYLRPCSSLEHRDGGLSLVMSHSSDASFPLLGIDFPFG